MKHLKIPNIPLGQSLPMKEVSTLMDHVNRHDLDFHLWKIAEIKPSVNFAIAYDSAALLLKFFVKEPTIRAVYRNTNEPVYEDTCVELFISFAQDANYYNFEFNCIGTCLGQYGESKQNRDFIVPDTLDKIETDTQFRAIDPGISNEWELTVKIPLSVLNRQEGLNIFDSDVRLNVYKCGDALPEPHFLAWNNVISTTPNFHLPPCFGSGSFDPIAK